MVIQDCAPLAHYLDDLINLLADHSYLINDNGDLKPMTPENTAVGPKSPKAFKESLAHQLRYFRFTHRTKMAQSGDEVSGLLTEEVDAKKFFEPDNTTDDVPQLEDPSDAEHHMLQTQHSAPIKAHPRSLQY